MGSTGARPGFAIERPFRELCAVVAYVHGPFGNQFFETAAIAGEQRADRTFVMWPVAGHDRHETIGRFLRLADAIPVLAGPPCRVDQFAQRDRGAARLPGQPFPVPW